VVWFSHTWVAACGLERGGEIRQKGDEIQGMKYIKTIACSANSRQLSMLRVAPWRMKM